MLSIPQELQTALESIAHPEAVVRAPHVRFTMLTSRLIRMEYSPQDVFEDRPSQAFWYRRQPVPEIEVNPSPNQIEITTEHLRLRYTINAKGFNRRSLSIELRESGRVWHHGDRDAGNLWGTARTLDDADGPVKLKRGLMSRSGWSVVDDSDGLVFNEQGWLEQRTASGNVDLYFFGYGHDFLGCLRDFCKV